MSEIKNAWIVEFRKPDTDDWMIDVSFPAWTQQDVGGLDNPIDLREARAALHIYRQQERGLDQFIWRIRYGFSVIAEKSAGTELEMTFKIDRRKVE